MPLKAVSTRCFRQRENVAPSAALSVHGCAESVSNEFCANTKLEFKTAQDVRKNFRYRSLPDGKLQAKELTRT